MWRWDKGSCVGILLLTLCLCGRTNVPVLAEDDFDIETMDALAEEGLLDIELLERISEQSGSHAEAARKADVPASSLSAPLCGEDEYIGLPTGTYAGVRGDMTQDLFCFYDAQGNIAGYKMSHLDVGERYLTLPKDRIALFYDNGEMVVVNTGDFSEITRFSSDCTHASGKDTFAVYHPSEKTLRVYERTKGLVFETQVTSNKTEEERVSVKLYEFDGGVYLKVTGDTVLACGILYPEGRWFSAEDPAFPQTLKDGICGSAGGYLLRKESDLAGFSIKETYSLIQTDGLFAYQGIRANVYWEHIRLGTTRENWVPFFLLPEGIGGEEEVYRVFRIIHESLEEIGRISETHLAYGRLTLIGDPISDPEGTAVVGLPCQALNGAICMGGILYNEVEVPYTIEEDGTYCIATQRDGLVRLLFPADETPSEVTGELTLTKKKEQDEWIVRRRSDGAILASTTAIPHIQEDSYLLDRIYGVQDSAYRIYDLNGQETYSSDRWILPCPPNYYAVTRGAYTGITDAYGRWIVRTLRFEEI